VLVLLRKFALLEPNNAMEQMADLFKPVTLPAQPGQPQKLAPIIIALQELALVHHQRNAWLLPDV
jgi:hypothetical protein